MTTNSLKPVCAAAAAMVTAAALLSPQMAPSDEVNNASDPSGMSDERLPAVTAFPKYPPAAWRDRVEGEVTVCFLINARGDVVRPSVRRSTHRIFEKPSMRAIRRSSFTPLQAGEEPATVKTCRTYRYRLDSANHDDAQAGAPPGQTAAARESNADPGGDRSGPDHRPAGRPVNE